MAKQEDFFDANLCLFLYFFFLDEFVSVTFKNTLCKLLSFANNEIINDVVFFDANKKNK